MSLGRGVANTAGILLLALAIFYSARYWPQRLPMIPESVAPVTEDARPDYVITDFHAIDLDESGRIRYELTATQLAHFGTPQRADLTAPDMIFYRDNHAEAGERPPWQLTARNGTLSESGKRLDLAGNVRVARLVAEDSDGMTMETEQLTVYGDREFAQTSRPVALRAAQAQLTGTGMDIDLKHGQLNLHTRVRGHYDPR